MLLSRFTLAAILTTLATLLIASDAKAGIDPLTFSPAFPTAGQPVSMIFVTRPCYAFDADIPGAVEIIQSGNTIDVIWSGIVETDPILCNFPTGPASRGIGSFPAGNYLVRLSIRRNVPPHNVLPPIYEGQLLVGGPAPHTVPATGLASLVALIALMLLAGHAWRRGSSALSAFLAVGMIATCMIEPAAAQTDGKSVYVELSPAAGAPTPQAIVEQLDFSAGIYPLESLSVSSPVGASYFINRPFRASGDFLDSLNQNPESPRARLEQTIIVHYPAGANIQAALNAFDQDAQIRYAHEVSEITFPPFASGSSTSSPTSTAGASGQYWVNSMQFPAAWARAGGWGMVGILDNGLAPAHPDLRSVDQNFSVTGGNFLAPYSVDVGRTGIPGFKGTSIGELDFNADERESVPTVIPNLVPCDADGDGFVTAAFAGHGTHVHGLVAASHANVDSTVGACKRCGLASAKVSYDRCLLQGTIQPQINDAAIWSALTIQAQIGIQVVSMSFGRSIGTGDLCTIAPDLTECKAIAYASSKGVLLLSASGNNRSDINFPARDPRVVAVGGYEEPLALWNEDKDAPPNNTDGCPFPGSNAECGSNITLNPASSARQEIIAPAKAVPSTFYPGMVWNSTLGCSDTFVGGIGSGQGACTGTSMSSPIAAGLAGLMRSINPLVGPGTGDPLAINPGVRDVIAASSLPLVGFEWTPQAGYGRPLADSAVTGMLGVSNSAVVKNRLTPLFEFYSAGSKDWAYTAVPQAALALLNAGASYAPQGPTTPGYASFPNQWPSPEPPAPRARVFVMTTEFKTLPSHPNLVPLHWIERSRPLPVGCTIGVPGCNGQNRDFLLLTSASQVQSGLSAGYGYRGLQGYVYGACANEPACIPAGAEKLWVGCKPADDDCAVFLERDRVSFESQGYSSSFAGHANRLLGYAYPNVDADGDGLVDGFELLIGTDPLQPDSDSDGAPDGVEFPQAGIATGDPCSLGRCNPETIFANGFE